MVYSNETWPALLEAASATDASVPDYISPEDFAGLLTDAYALAAARLAPVSRLFELAAALPPRATALTDSGAMPPMAADGATSGIVGNADMSGSYGGGGYGEADLPDSTAGVADMATMAAAAAGVESAGSNDDASLAAYQRPAWEALSAMATLKGLIIEDGCSEDLDAFVLSLTGEAVATLGATPTPDITAQESWDRRLARARVLNLVTGLPASPEIPEVVPQLAAYLDGSGELSPDVREAVMKIAIGAQGPLQLFGFVMGSFCQHLWLVDTWAQQSVPVCIL